jgi:uncharacterized protein (DUF3820 family)
MEIGGRMPKILTDQSLMPFGKYGPTGKGVTMEKVPARYLFWLWNSGLGDEKEIAHGLGLNDDRIAVREYIKANMSALQQEDSDTIIKKY